MHRTHLHKGNNGLHFSYIAVQLSKRQKAAYIRRRDVSLYPFGALVKEIPEQVLVRESHN